MNESIKASHDCIQDSIEKVKEALELLPKLKHKSARKVSMELMKALFDLRDAKEEIYELEPLLKPESSLEKEEYILDQISKARELEKNNDIKAAEKIYKEILNNPEMQMAKESSEAGLYRCSQKNLI
jgi:hypothetical protein